MLINVKTVSFFYNVDLKTKFLVIQWDILWKFVVLSHNFWQFLDMWPWHYLINMWPWLYSNWWDMTYKWPWYYHATVKKRDSQDAWMVKLVHANVLGNLILGVSHAYISQINMLTMQDSHQYLTVISTSLHLTYYGT